MADSYIAVCGYYGNSVVGPYYLRRRERYSSFRGKEVHWWFDAGDGEAFRFVSLKMALYRVNTLTVVQDYVKRGGRWEIVEITPIKVLASNDDGPLQQLARAAV